jgi:hypothetical protein
MVLCLLKKGVRPVVSLCRGESGVAFARRGGASRPTPPDYPHAGLMATQIGSILSRVGGPDTRYATCQFIPLLPLSWQGHGIWSAAARSLLERSTMSINAWGCMFWKVRARAEAGYACSPRKALCLSEDRQDLSRPYGEEARRRGRYAFSLSLVPVERPCSVPFFGTIHTQADDAV